MEAQNDRDEHIAFQFLVRFLPRSASACAMVTDPSSGLRAATFCAGTWCPDAISVNFSGNVPF
ncbi:hypothetical protein LMG28727_06540 [Paraburkholderia kirstenboschensis]|nr:hypothetical protein LMG28727_06540 [Paraburkholderia kirstenboschensis]